MKWHWTPGGWLRVILAISLLAGAAFVENVVPVAVFWLMIVSGLLLLLYSWVATAVNIKRKNEEARKDNEQK